MTIQTHNYQNKNTTIDLLQIPQYSDSTKEILSQFRSNLPESFCTPGKLLSTIHNLEETKEMLQNTREHGTRDKILAFAKAAALTTALGLAVLCGFHFLAGPSLVGILGLELGAFGFVGLSALFAHQAHQSLNTIDQLRPEPPKFPNHALFSFSYAAVPNALLGFGFIAPLIEVFTRESRLNNAIQEQNAAIEDMLSASNKENNRILPIARQFYQEQGEALLNEIDESMKQSASFLEFLLDRPGRDESIDALVIKDLKIKQKAKNELQSVIAFYQQF